jgi:1,4-dihydroxy-2-naphthoate octaprenyltransferase
VFFAVYTAHVKDGYVDFHRRGEDEEHPLTVDGCELALWAATGLHLAALAGLWVVAGAGAVAVTAPTWLIAYHHAPQLDTNPVGATAGYPAGIGLCVLGGYVVQTGTVAAEPAGFAAVFLVLLSGVKVVDDAQDYEYDRSIDKRTVAVVLGRARARRVAFGLMAAALALVAGLAVVGTFPPTAALAVVPFAAVAAVASRAEPELATMLLVRAAYLFLAVLVAVAWLRPLG